VITVLSSITSAMTPVADEDFKLLASDGASENYFGYSVSISNDGTTTIVGARYDDDNGFQSGSAYIYDIEGPDCPDITGDGVVDVNDLLILIAYWGACTGTCDGDVNDDGTVDVDVLLIVISNWGPCP